MCTRNFAQFEPHPPHESGMWRRSSLLFRTVCLSVGIADIVVPRRTAQSRVSSSAFCKRLEISIGSLAALVQTVTLPPTSAITLEAHRDVWTDSARRGISIRRSSPVGIGGSRMYEDIVAWLFPVICRQQVCRWMLSVRTSSGT